MTPNQKPQHTNEKAENKKANLVILIETKENTELSNTFLRSHFSPVYFTCWVDSICARTRTAPIGSTFAAAILTQRVCFGCDLFERASLCAYRESLSWNWNQPCNAVGILRATHVPAAVECEVHWRGAGVREWSFTCWK